MRNDLRSETLAWARQWWDAEQHMMWNPAGGLSRDLPARTLHQVPNTAWMAYALLGEANDDDYAEAIAAIERLLALQYDDPAKKFHGTFAQFLETPYPADDAHMWIHYDPNWRQFVGTTFAVIVEDFGAVLPDNLVARIEAGIGLACEGEAAEGRLTATYANPALMRAWLDGWFGRRRGDDSLVQRGEDFARAIVAEHDRCGAFEEFNSPRYYGIDLYALRLWVTFPPSDYFAEHARRLETALWRHVAAGYHAGLRNYCGPYTRSYHPDATSSVTLFALWQWALFGREHTPLPPLEVDVIDHGHDLSAGPLFARLAEPPRGVDLSAFADFGAGRRFEQSLPNGRLVTAVLTEMLMFGAESSENDWGGWGQFMPVTVHWREPNDVGVLWLTQPRVVRATARNDSILFAEVEAEISFALSGVEPVELKDGFRAGNLICVVTGARVTRDSPRRLTLHPTNSEVALRFVVAG